MNTIHVSRAIKGQLDYGIRQHIYGRRSTDGPGFDYWKQVTCPECGRHYWSKRASERVCDYCAANPIQKDNDAYKPQYQAWVIIIDKSPADCRFRDGASFSREDIEAMSRNKAIPPGSVFRHRRTGQYARVLKGGKLSYYGGRK